MRLLLDCAAAEGSVYAGAGADAGILERHSAELCGPCRLGRRPEEYWF